MCLLDWMGREPDPTGTVNLVTQEMLIRMWEELGYRLDFLLAARDEMIPPNNNYGILRTKNVIMITKMSQYI